MTTEPKKADQQRNPKFRGTTFSTLWCPSSLDCLFLSISTEETFPTCNCSCALRDVSLPAHLLSGERGGEAGGGFCKDAMAQQSGKTLNISWHQPAAWVPPRSFSQPCQNTYFTRRNLSYFWFAMRRAGDPFSLSNKMSIDIAPTAANLLYLVYFKTHIQAVPNTAILVRDVTEDSGSKQE